MSNTERDVLSVSFFKTHLDFFSRRRARLTMPQLDARYRFGVVSFDYANNLCEVPGSSGGQIQGQDLLLKGTLVDRARSRQKAELSSITPAKTERPVVWWMKTQTLSLLRGQRWT